MKTSQSLGVALLLLAVTPGMAEPPISKGTIGYLEPMEIKVANADGVAYLHFYIGFNEPCRLLVTTPFEVLTDDLVGVLVKFPATRMLDAMEAMGEGFAHIWPWSDSPPSPACLPGTTALLTRQSAEEGIGLRKVRELAKSAEPQ